MAEQEENRQAKSQVVLSLIPIDYLHPNHWNPHKRRAEIEEKLRKGIEETLARGDDLPPLIVRPHPDIEGHYEIIDGEGRYVIARKLKLDAVPCQIWDVDTPTAIRLTIALNEVRGQRDDEKYWSAIAEFVQSGGVLTDLEYSVPEDLDAVAAGLDIAGLAEAALYVEKALDELEQREEEAVLGEPTGLENESERESVQGYTPSGPEIGELEEATHEHIASAEGAEDAAPTQADVQPRQDEEDDAKAPRVVIRLRLDADVYARLLHLCDKLGYAELTDAAVEHIVRLAEVAASKDDVVVKDDGGT